MLIFTLLTFAFLVMLVVGLINPSKAIFWSKNRTRGKVLLIYGLASIISFFMLGVLAPEKEKTAAKEFLGQVVFETTISGDSSAAKSLADMGIPSKTIVQFGENCFQCTEVGGLANGTFFKDTAKYKSWFLDSETKRAMHGTCSNIDENVNDALRQLLPYTYKTELKPTEDTLAICGYTTKKYKVLKSAFVRDYATAYVWITKDLKFPLQRYDFQTENRRMVTPLPLSLINDVGAILKVEVEEAGVLVTYTATSLEQKDYNAFEIPEGYTIVNDSN